jgi:LmbE family N-acetylglucosaminyl deacetylase
MRLSTKHSIITQIIQDKRPCYFVSPHFDDAVFSAGSLLFALSGQTKLVLVNVFTKAGSRHTLSAKAYLRQCQAPDAVKLYKERLAEDKGAVSGIVDEIVNLGFTEALWRKERDISKVRSFLGRFIPESVHTYPTYRFHVARGVIALSDRKLIAKLRKYLQTLPSDAVIFCPRGVGDHVDHLLVREACLQSQRQIVQWVDFPYSEREKDSLASQDGWKLWTFPVQVREKRKLMQAYRTQYAPMFGAESVKLPDERYLSRKEIR